MNQSGRYPAHNRVGGNIFGYYGSGSHYRIVAYGDTLQNGGIGTHPHIATQYDGGGVGRLAVLRSEPVVEGGKYDPMTYLATVAEGNASVVLEVTAVVNEYIFAQVDILSKVGIDGREEPYRSRYGLAGELSEQFAYFVGGMVRAVQLAGDASGLVAHPVHEFTDFGAAERFTGSCMFQKFFECHRLVFVLSIYGRMLRSCRRG